MKLKQQLITVEGFGKCVERSLLNEQNGLDLQYGTLFVFDKNINSFDMTYSHHVYNIDENDNIYDDMSALNNEVKMGDFKTKCSSQWNVKLVNGEDLPTNNRLSTGKMLIKKFNKYYKNYDAIYVSNWAFHNDDVTVFDYEHIDAIEREIDKCLVA